MFTPDLAGPQGLPGNLRLLGFYDFAHGGFNRTEPGTYNKTNMASVGLGLRYALGRNASIRADMARVVDNGPRDTEVAGAWYGHVELVIGY